MTWGRWTLDDGAQHRRCRVQGWGKASFRSETWTGSSSFWGRHVEMVEDGLLTKSRPENEEAALVMDPVGGVAKKKTMLNGEDERPAKKVVGCSIPSVLRVGLIGCATLSVLTEGQASGGYPWARSGSLEASELLNEDDPVHDDSRLRILGHLGGTHPRATRLVLEYIPVLVHAQSMIHPREPRVPLLSSPDVS